MALELTEPWAGQTLASLYIYTAGSFKKEAPWGTPWCAWSFVVIAKDCVGNFVVLGVARGPVTEGDVNVLAPTALNNFAAGIIALAMAHRWRLEVCRDVPTTCLYDGNAAGSAA